MSAHRFTFYLPSLTPQAPEFELVGDEHHHAARVLRLADGEDVYATNGRGLLVEATISSVEKQRSIARVTRVAHDRPPARRVTLAMALLPRANFEAALWQSIEVGATDIIPLVAERCRTKSWNAGAAERSRRVAIAAMKQSGRSWLPSIADVLAVSGLAGAIVANRYDACVLGAIGAPPLPSLSHANNVLAVVGPEADFTEAEAARLAQAGAIGAAISPNRLRAETAATVLVAALVGPV